MTSIYVEILGNAKQFKAELDGAVASTAKANGGFAKMSKAAGIAGLALTGGLAYGLAKSVEAAGQFQSSMELIQTQAGGSAKEVRNMSKALLGMAASVGQTPEELSKGLYHVESAGFRGAKALSVLRLAAEAAAVGHSDLEQTTTALVAAQRSGIKGLGDMSHAMGSLNAIVGAGNMHMDDLTSALGTGILPVAKAFGLSVSDVGAALATMTSNGIPAVNAASGLKMMMASLAAPTVGAAKALKTIGLTSSELADTMRNKGLQPALAELRAHLTGAGLNATQTAALLTTAFGKKSSTGLLTLIGNLDDMKKAQKQVQDGASTFGENWQETQRTSEFASKKFHAALSALAVGLGASLLPAVTSVTQELATMTGFLVQHTTLAKGLVIGLGALAAVLLATSVGMKAAAGESVLWTAATHIATAAQWLWNAALDANPIGLVVLAIAGLVAGIVILYTQSGTARAILNDIKDAVLPVLSSAFGALKSAVQTAGSAIATAAGGIKTAVKASLGFITDTVIPDLRTAWNSIQPVVQPLINYLAGPFKVAFDTVKGIINVVKDLLNGDFSKAWTDAKALIGKLFDDINTMFGGLPGKLLGYVKDIGSAAVKIGSAIVDGIGSGLSTLGSALASGVKAPINAIIDEWNGLSFSIPGFDSHIPGVGKVGGQTISVPHVPRLAMGGIVTRPTLAMIGEAGPEAVVPLSRGGFGGGLTVHVHVAGSVIKGNELGVVVRDALIPILRRNPNLFAGKG